MIILYFFETITICSIIDVRKCLIRINNVTIRVEKIIALQNSDYQKKPSLPPEKRVSIVVPAAADEIMIVCC